MSLDEATHTYRNSLRPNMRFTSVTTMLSEYHDEFDEEYHAERIAKRDGLVKEEIIREWREINRVANVFGTAVHATMERYLLAPQRFYIPRDEFEKLLIERFVEMLKENQLALLRSNTIWPEHIMHLDLTGYRVDITEEGGLAGTADIIEDLYDDKFNVWDFKTNKKLEFENKYDEWLKYPVQHLNHSQYNLYSLQISIYAFMYELETGRKFNRGGIFYWDRNKEIWIMIPVIYMKREVELLLNHYKQAIFPTVKLK